MKIYPANFTRIQHQRGSAVVGMIALLTIMVMLAAANSSALFHLHRELNLLEHRQIERLNTSRTNATVIVVFPATPDQK